MSISELATVYGSARRQRILATLVTRGVLAAFCWWSVLSFAQTCWDGCTRVYVTKNGDTLYDIAASYLRDPSDWRVVSELNRLPLPRLLRPGISLRLPVRLLKQVSLTARAIAVNGPVERAFRNGAFIPLSVGTALGEGDRLRTGHNGFATFELNDGSHIVLAQDSSIDIDSLRQTMLTGSVDRVFGLQHGEVTSEVSHALKRDDRFQIRSPSVVAGVRGTQFRVSYNATDLSTAVTVLNGAVGVDAAGHLAPPAGQPLQASAKLIPKNFGNVTRASGEVGAAVGLLPAPTLQQPGKLQGAVAITFDLVPQADARAWKVAIARDAGMLDLIQDSRVTAPQASFENLSDGSYFVRVSAIDSHGLEGMPRVYAFERRLFGLEASANARAAGRDYQFKWYVSKQSEATHFRFVLAKSPSLADPLIDKTDLQGGELVVKDLPQGVYYWTVIAERFEGGRLYEADSTVRSFTLAR